MNRPGEVVVTLDGQGSSVVALLVEQQVPYGPVGQDRLPARCALELTIGSVGCVIELVPLGQRRVNQLTVGRDQGGCRAGFHLVADCLLLVAVDDHGDDVLVDDSFCGLGFAFAERGRTFGPGLWRCNTQLKAQSGWGRCCWRCSGRSGKRPGGRTGRRERRPTIIRSLLTSPKEAEGGVPLAYRVFHVLKDEEGCVSSTT